MTPVLVLDVEVVEVDEVRGVLVSAEVVVVDEEEGDGVVAVVGVATEAVVGLFSGSFFFAGGLHLHHHCCISCFVLTLTVWTVELK